VYIRISKPMGGKVNVEFDATRGATQFHERFTDVALADLPALVIDQDREYKRRRQLLKEARKRAIK
jgi:hypothetical protein